VRLTSLAGKLMAEAIARARPSGFDVLFRGAFPIADFRAARCCAGPALGAGDAVVMRYANRPLRDIAAQNRNGPHPIKDGGALQILDAWEA